MVACGGGILALPPAIDAMFSRISRGAQIKDANPHASTNPPSVMNVIDERIAGCLLAGDCVLDMSSVR